MYVVTRTTIWTDNDDDDDDDNEDDEDSDEDNDNDDSDEDDSDEDDSDEDDNDESVKKDIFAGITESNWHSWREHFSCSLQKLYLCAVHLIRILPFNQMKILDMKELA